MQRTHPEMVSVNGADALGLGYSRLTPALVRGGKDVCAGLESSVPLEVQLSRGTATELKSWQDQLCPFVRSFSASQKQIIFLRFISANAPNSGCSQ